MIKPLVACRVACACFFAWAPLVFAAQVLDGSGIRIEFDSEARGFDCLSIKNKLNGKDVLFGDGASAKWRIQVRNRSKAWGLAEVEYPIVRHVVVSNTPHT